MLTITIPAGSDFFDEIKEEFVVLPEIKMELEHSLVSLSKWESHFEKPFLTETEKTDVETLWYVRAMTIAPNVPAEAYSRLTNDHLSQINDYIGAKMTATWFAKRAQQ